MKLCDLSSDLLGLILRDKSVSFMTVRLWKVGNKILLSKMAQGITHVHLEAAKFMPCRFPLFLTQLRGLRHLYVGSAASRLVTNDWDWTPIITKLSGSLRELRICCVRGDQVLRNYAPEREGKAESIVSTDAQGNRTHFIAMEELFPCLHTLEIRCTKSQRFLRNPDLSGLPSSLTSLTADLCLLADELDSGEIDDIVMSKLPRGLVELCGCIQVEEYDWAKSSSVDWENAPPALESLIINDTMMSGVLSSIPRKLKRLERAENEAIYRFHLQKAVISAWDFQTSQDYPPLVTGFFMPYNISYSTFSDQGGDWLAQLPRFLTHLEIPFESPPPSFNLHHLPSTLQTIKIHDEFDWRLVKSQLAKESAWPPALTSLDAPKTSRFCATDIKLLPQTLRHLSIRLMFLGIKDVAANELPPALTSLSLFARIEFTIVGRLPSTLTSLKVAETNLHPFSELPQSLISFDAPIAYDYDHMDKLFSPRLTTLVLHNWECCWHHLLPRTITALSINNLRNDPRQKSQDCLFDNLPEGLKRLIIRFGLSVPVPLPRLHLPVLEALDVSNTEFSSALLRSLPRTLKELKMPVTTLNREDLPFVPPCLTLMQLGASPSIADAFLQHNMARFWPIRCSTQELEISEAAFITAIDKRRKELVQD